ncbi:MAG: alkaline phosphatase family protein [Candidatus Tumulicola sp.]
MKQTARFAPIALAGMLAGCSTPGGFSGNAMRTAALPESATAYRLDEPANSSAYIKHVVIVIQENRTFDDFFATYPGADGATTGKTHTGRVVPLKRVPLAYVTLSNGWSSFATAYDGGKMDGFDLDTWGGPGRAGLRPYTYVNPNDIKPYWTMAQQYALGDHMFQGEGSGSFTAHQELVAGGEQIDSAHALVNWPASPDHGAYAWGCDAPKGTVTSLITKNDDYESKVGPFPCLTYTTLADQLDAKKLSWRYYSGALKLGGAGYMWNAFEAIKAVRYGSDWTSHISTPSSAILHDIPHGKLADVTWLTPSVPDSDHESRGPDHGPSWVTQVVNAIGESQFWDSTAIVVVWDDWGGHYDHEPPPQFGFGELGLRVPLLVISPYVRAGTISHTQYEFGSILRFVEANWGLKPMQAPDRRASSIVDIFDFTQKPRAFIPIKAALSRAFFEQEAPSNLPGDGE